jgi:hypothetical protein
MGISFKRRGPKYGASDQERIRAKIADGGTLERLQKAFKGEIELTQGQVAIGLKFLDKLVPNLQSVEAEVTQQAPFALLPAAAPNADAWHKAFAPHKPIEGATAPKPATLGPDTTKH